MTAAAHDHAGGGAHAHAHAPTAASLAGSRAARRALALALGIALVVFVLEVVAGFAFGSLALLGDAAHMFTDAGAYAIALWAAHVARRPSSPTRTYGHGRAEILAALANGATLLAASAWIVVEALRRLSQPQSVDAAGMSAVAALGLLANVVVFAVLWRARSDSLNMRGALLHAAGDLLGSVAALGAGLVILATGYERADPLASLLLTVLIAIGAWRLVRASADVLLDVAPAGIDAERVGGVALEVPDVLEIHDVHVWTMAPGEPSASAHVRIAAGADAAAVLDALQAALRDRLGIRHTTMQLRVDRGTVPLETVPLMNVEDAVDWATDHVASAHPDLSRAVIAAAAGAAAIGLAATGRVSPVAVSSRTLSMLRRRPAGDAEDTTGPADV